MQIALLSRKRTLYSTKRLVQECRVRQVKPVVLNPLKCDIVVGKKGHFLYYNRRKLPEIDVVIPRIGSSIMHHGVAVLRQFQYRGIPSVNRSAGISRARDKYQTLQILYDAGVPVPPTVLVREPANISQAIDRVGGLPVIVKLVRGTQGTGIVVLDSKQAVETTVEALWKMGRPMLIQQYIIESRGKDIRVVVVDGRVVASYLRIARPGEFRSNFHKGALCVPNEITPVQSELAVRAAQALDLGVAGVDMLDSVAGMMVLEVNASPGFEGVERVAGVNVGGEIVDFAVKLGKKRGSPESRA